MEQWLANKSRADIDRNEFKPQLFPHPAIFWIHARLFSPLGHELIYVALSFKCSDNYIFLEKKSTRDILISKSPFIQYSGHFINGASCDVDLRPSIDRRLQNHVTSHLHASLQPRDRVIDLFYGLPTFYGLFKSEKYIFNCLWIILLLFLSEYCIKIILDININSIIMIYKHKNERHDRDRSINFYLSSE